MVVKGEQIAGNSDAAFGTFHRLTKHKTARSGYSACTKIHLYTECFVLSSHIGTVSGHIALKIISIVEHCSAWVEHLLCTSIHSQFSSCHVRAETTCKEAHNPCHLNR
jgi:uncharacterized membrane protein